MVQFLIGLVSKGPLYKRKSGLIPILCLINPLSAHHEHMGGNLSAPYGLERKREIILVIATFQRDF